MSAATQVSYILSPQGKNTTESPTFILHDPEYTASGMGVVFTAPGSSDAHFMKSRTRAASGVAAAHKMYSRYSAQKITPSATGRSRALHRGEGGRTQDSTLESHGCDRLDVSAWRMQHLKDVSLWH